MVEGQEDVIYFNKILEKLGISLNGTFYGWGVGGAENTDKIARMLQDLGFKKVVVILDNDKKDKIQILKEKFPEYEFKSIPTKDVRDKKAVIPREEVKGLIDIRGETVYPEYKEVIENMFNEVNKFLE